MATNVPVTNEPPVAAELRGGGAMPTLRYSGFDQQQNTRYYMFQYRASAAEKARAIVVSADIPLLVKHRVRIQDGPDLCLRTLMLEIAGFDTSQAGAMQRTLTAEDLLAYLASQPVPASKSKRIKRADGETDGQSQ
jgi:hypothetical protein